MKLTMVIESAQEPDFGARLIPLLETVPLAQILSDPLIAPRLEPLLERHQRSIEVLRQRSEYKDGAVFFDLPIWRWKAITNSFLITCTRNARTAWA